MTGKDAGRARELGGGEVQDKGSIAIVGAGIGGLALAGLLSRQGYRPQLFDQFDAPAPVGSGLVIQPVGQDVLAALDLLDDACALGAPIRHMQGIEAQSGRVVLDVAYDRSGAARFGLGIHRAALFDLLYRAALSAGVAFRPGHRVVSRDGQYLRFAEGRDGPFDLIIDASGAGSVLSRIRRRELRYGAIWGNVAWPDTALTRNALTQRYRRADRMMGVLPIGRLPGGGRDMAAIFWSLPQDRYADWRAGGLARWRDEAAALWPAFTPFLAGIGSVDDMTLARYAHGTLPRPHGPGIVTIGDAAHQASPQLGQGANMALLDACALARAIEQRGIAGAGPAYARARRWHVRLYQGMSWAFTPQYQSDSRLLPVLRDHVLMPVSRLPGMPYMLSRLVCGDLIAPY